MNLILVVHMPGLNVLQTVQVQPCFLVHVYFRAWAGPGFGPGRGGGNGRGHVRYINILTWLRGFQVKLLYLVLFSLYQSFFWELTDKRNLKNLQF